MDFRYPDSNLAVDSISWGYQGVQNDEFVVLADQASIDWHQKRVMLPGVTVVICYPGAFTVTNFYDLFQHWRDTKLKALKLVNIKVTQTQIKQLRTLVTDENLIYRQYSPNTLKSLLKNRMINTNEIFESCKFSTYQYLQLLASPSSSLRILSPSTHNGISGLYKSIKLLNISNLVEITFESFPLDHIPNRHEQTFLFLEAIITNPSRQIRVNNLVIKLTLPIHHLFKKSYFTISLSITQVFRKMQFADYNDVEVELNIHDYALVMTDYFQPAIHR